MIESQGDAKKLEEALRSTKCNLNAFDTRGFAFIHWAACYGFTKCVEVLVRCGADITLQTLVSLADLFHLKDERSAFDVAVDYEKKDTAEWIQFTASEVIVCFLVNCDPKDFFNAITNDDKSKLKNCLMDPHAKYFRNLHGMTGLHIACQCNATGGRCACF